MKRKIKKKQGIILIIFLALIIPTIFSISIKAPEGMNVLTKWYDIYDLEVLFDTTYKKDGEYIHDLSILDNQIQMINNAEKYILIDMFLLNNDYNKEKNIYPQTSKIFADALINKKIQNPQIDIVVITDPVNNFYGSFEQEIFTRLKQYDIDIIITDLTKLRDSNVIYSGVWRTYINWLGQSGFTWIPNLEDKTAPNVNVRSVLASINAKGNHRKVIITEKEAMITSANIHDASSYHCNVAFKFSSDVINELIQTEKMVANISGYTKEKLDKEYKKTDNIDSSKGKIRVLTEKGIYTALKENIDNMHKGDTIYVCAFYLSDFDIIKGLLDASKRGVEIYMILDKNENALGTKLYGIPNRSAINSMYKNSNGKINIRWYNANEIQYHTKMIMFKTKEYMDIIGGSANFTRRNIKGYTLETNVEIKVDVNSNISIQMQEYFSKLWDNIDGNYTVSYDVYKDDNILKYWLYLFEEATGFGTF